MVRSRPDRPVPAPSGEADFLLAAEAAFELVGARDVDGALSVVLRSCVTEPVRVAALLALDYYGKPRLSLSCPAEYASSRAFDGQLAAGPVLDCVRSGRPVLQARIRRRDRAQYAVWARRAGCTSAAAAPVFAGGRTVGAVALLGREGLPVEIAAAAADLIAAILAPHA